MNDEAEHYEVNMDTIEPIKGSLSGKWIQRGPYIINRVSGIEHGQYIGVNKRLVGVTKNGEPILEELK